MMSEITLIRLDPTKRFPEEWAYSCLRFFEDPGDTSIHGRLLCLPSIVDRNSALIGYISTPELGDSEFEELKESNPDLWVDDRREGHTSGQMIETRGFEALFRMVQSLKPSLWPGENTDLRGGEDL